MVSKEGHDRISECAPPFQSGTRSGPPLPRRNAIRPGSQEVLVSWDGVDLEATVPHLKSLYELCWSIFWYLVLYQCVRDRWRWRALTGGHPSRAKTTAHAHTDVDYLNMVCVWIVVVTVAFNLPLLLMCFRRICKTESERGCQIIDITKQFVMRSEI